MPRLNASLSEPLPGVHVAWDVREDEYATTLAWSPDDKQLAIAYGSGAVVVLDRPGRRLA
jgi:hypothetical protein